MAPVSPQLDAGIPLGARCCQTGRIPNWRIRALTAAITVAVGGDACGWWVRAECRTLADPAVPGRSRASARTAGE
jgi:hypothetical protein